MSDTSRCLACMTELSDSAMCQACGWQEGAEPDNSLYLPRGYLLNNRYLIGMVVGAGGFGVVYVAWDNNLEVRVAVKEFLPKELAARSTNHISLTPYKGSVDNDFAVGIDKFLDEAKALARFQDHAGIVHVYESFRANNTAYMVMQFLDGMTLKQYLKRQPGEKIAFSIAIKAMIPIMDALQEVHRAGFVHRDISPDNIFITRQNQIKLLDFGAARYAIGEHSKSLTSVLKHGYAPVEQYSSKGNQGPWSDVYAVAATIYRCVTGTPPPDAMERVQEDTIRNPKQLGIELPQGGEVALMKGLAIKAADRYENIQLFQQALMSVYSSPRQQTVTNEVIKPSRPSPKLVECPECGAKNQLDPGDDPRELRCGKCKKELGIKPVGSKLVTRNENQHYPSHDKSKEDQNSAYGIDFGGKKNYKLIYAKAIVAIVISVMFGYFISGNKDSSKTSAKSPSNNKTIQETSPTYPEQSSVQSSKPEIQQERPMQAYVPKPEPSQQSRDLSKDVKYITSAEGVDFFYYVPSYKLFSNGTIEVLIISTEDGANYSGDYLHIYCHNKTYKATQHIDYRNERVVNVRNNNNPMVYIVNPGTVMESLFSYICSK